jgi:hypothetical protein
MNTKHIAGTYCIYRVTNTPKTLPYTGIPHDGPSHLEAVHDAWVNTCECLDLVKVALGLAGGLHCCCERGIVAQHNQAPPRVTIATHNLEGSVTRQQKVRLSECIATACILPVLPYCLYCLHCLDSVHHAALYCLYSSARPTGATAVLPGRCTHVLPHALRMYCRLCTASRGVTVRLWGSGARACRQRGTLHLS